MRPHVAIIDPASRVAEIDSLNRLQDTNDVKFTYHLPALYGMDSLNTLRTSIDGIIIFGSGASVYDELPWQGPMNYWLEPHIEKGTPILGLCYGHQLLAHLLGGKIGFVSEDQSKLVGLRKITLLDKNDFWQGQKEGHFVVSHREHITKLPSDCEIMATSPECEVDGFRHLKKPIWGMQSHPEAGPGFVDNQSLPMEKHESNFDSGELFLRKFISKIITNSKT